MIQALQDLLGKPAAVITIPVKPIPASRPKVGRWGAYYPKPYKDWLEQAVRLVRPGRLNPQSDSRFVVLVDSVLPRPKTSILDLPIGDVDNYAKGPLDVISKVGGYWLDDRQVQLLLSNKDWATGPEQVSTHIHIWKTK